VEYHPDAQGSWELSRCKDGYLLCLPPLGATFLMAEEDRAALPPPAKGSKIIELSSRWDFTPSRRNCLILDRWAVIAGKDTLLDRMDFATETRILPPQPLKSLSFTSFPLKVCYKTAVRLKGKPGRFALVRERSSFEGVGAVYVNGIPVEKWTQVREYDCYNFEASLAEIDMENDPRFYRAHELTIAVVVTADKPDQGLLHPLRLFGDFTVELNNHETIGATLTAVQAPLILHCGSWTHQGFPHYAGAGLYEQPFALLSPDTNSRYMLKLDTAGNVARVWVNDQEAGTLIHRPFELDITALIHAGDNKLAVSVTNTLENLLYGLDGTSGMMGPAEIYQVVNHDPI
jgi:hypothetical protein